MHATIFCPKCDFSGRVPSDYLGLDVKCPKCGGRFTARSKDHVPDTVSEDGSIPASKAVPDTVHEDGEILVPEKGKAVHPSRVKR